MIIAGVIGFLFLIILFAGCHRVSPTEVGFKINNSGDYRGVDSLPVITGYNFVMPGFSSIVTLPTTQQHVVWSSDEKEGPGGQEQESERKIAEESERIAQASDREKFDVILVHLEVCPYPDMKSAKHKKLLAEVKDLTSKVIAHIKAKV